MHGWAEIFVGIVVVFVALCSVALCMSAGFLLGSRRRNVDGGPAGAVIGWLVGFILMIIGVVYGGYLIFDGAAEMMHLK